MKTPKMYRVTVTGSVMVMAASKKQALKSIKLRDVPLSSSAEMVTQHDRKEASADENDKKKEKALA